MHNKHNIILINLDNILYYLVCADPPTAPAYSWTIPPNISGQFLVGDTIVYFCNGDLTPNEPTTTTCQDLGPLMAVWSTTLVPNCSKLIITRFEKYRSHEICLLYG